ncbi:MAG: hypothetical protein ACTSWW_03515 [Promethearchaeota archaeon]
MENAHSEKSEEMAFSASDFTLRQKFTLFNKPIVIQYLILSLWIISGVMGLYYLLYEASYEDFVRMGILPYNLEWMVVVLSIFILIGLGFLFYPVDPMKYDKLRLEQHFDQELVRIESILEEAHFSKAFSQIENLLTTLNSHHIATDRSTLLLLLRKAEFNLVLLKQIKDLRDTFNELSSSQKTMKYRNIKARVYENSDLIHYSVNNQFHDLSSIFPDDFPTVEEFRAISSKSKQEELDLEY